jgi:hypothetical protein
MVKLTPENRSIVPIADKKQTKHPSSIPRPDDPRFIAFP